MLLSFKGGVKCSLTNSFETKTSFLFTDEFRAADVNFLLLQLGNQTPLLFEQFDNFSRSILKLLLL